MLVYPGTQAFCLSQNWDMTFSPATRACQSVPRFRNNSLSHDSGPTTQERVVHLECPRCLDCIDQSLRWPAGGATTLNNYHLQNSGNCRFSFSQPNEKWKLVMSDENSGRVSILLFCMITLGIILTICHENTKRKHVMNSFSCHKHNLDTFF